MLPKKKFEIVFNTNADLRYGAAIVYSHYYYAGNV